VCLFEPHLTLKRKPDDTRTLLLAELHFLFLRLREYPKCYWIWLYRKWCLEICPDADWDTELKLVTKMLEADARNCIRLKVHSDSQFMGGNTVGMSWKISKNVADNLLLKVNLIIQPLSRTTSRIFPLGTIVRTSFRISCLRRPM
jgi:hypothetical protein